MKRWCLWIVAGLMALPPAAGVARAAEERVSHLLPDASAPEGLWTWNDPVPWRVAAWVSRVNRPVRMDKADWDWQSDALEAEVEVAPWGWLSFYGRAGAYRGKMEKGSYSAGRTDVGAGGALGAKITLWEISPERDTAAWRFTVGAQGEYAWRSGTESEGPKAKWEEAWFFLPLNYHLTMHITQRSSYATEAHGMDLFVGPACSLLDGTWTEQTVESDFTEHQMVGISGGLRIWLLENLGITGWVDWFDACSYRAGVEYRF